MDRTRLTRWLIPLPAILFALTAQNANAEPIPGIETTYYTIDQIPPTQSTTEYLVCGTEIENNINRNYDYELFEDCTGDLFMIHMTGFIDIPEHDTIEFMLATDDGGTMEIGNDSWGNWNDQGCSWMMSGELTLESGSNAFEVWMYEHGGNACMMLAWNIDNEGWEMVPDPVFTQQAVAPTTTTSSTTSTSTTTTTTTMPPTTTTSSTTTLPEETTTTSEPVQSSTTTSTTSTTTSTTTTVAPTPTTTQAPYTPPQTTTTSEPVVTTTSSTTTTTSLPEPSTTVEETSTTSSSTTTSTTTTEPATTTTESTTTSTTYPDGLPEDTVEPVETTIPETTVPEIPETTVPDETEQPTDTTQPQEYITETTLLEEQDSSTTTVPELVTDEQVAEALKEVIENEPVTDKQIEQILETLSEAAPEQIVAAITQVLAADITSDQATEIASSPEVLAAITETQAEELFEQIVVEELTEEQLEQFTEAIQEAPTKIKKAFEKTIDVFGSQFEEYVPTGSSIPVKTRRTLVAVGALMAAIPPTKIRR